MSIDPNISQNDSEAVPEEFDIPFIVDNILESDQSDGNTSEYFKED
ncbi:hypothetical protein [Acinetobacter baumannii]